MLWLDAQDVDGDGYSDAGYADGVPMPLWIDKSLSEKQLNNQLLKRLQTTLEMFGGLPAF